MKQPEPASGSGSGFKKNVSAFEVKRFGILLQTPRRFKKIRAPFFEKNLPV